MEVQVLEEVGVEEASPKREAAGVVPLMVEEVEVVDLVKVVVSCFLGCSYWPMLYCQSCYRWVHFPSSCLQYPE